MKKIILVIFLCSVFITYATAQEYDKFQVELQGGINRPTLNFSSGYGLENKYSNFGGFKIGVRYSINEYFGIKGSYINDVIKGAGWKTHNSGVDLEGTVNLGRVLHFETWTNRLNVIAHLGPGISWFNYDRTNIDGDRVGSIIGGLTGQFRVGNKVSLFLDGSTRVLYRQHKSFDGGKRQAVRPAIYSIQFGLSFSLGKKGNQSADWYVRASSLATARDINALRAQIDESNRNINTNRSLLNTLSNRVDGLDSKIKAIESKEVVVEQQDILKELFNNGHINAFYAFDSYIPYDSNINSVYTVVRYLQSNTSANIILSGYADERGTDKYNQELSLKRAEELKKMLVDAGINPSRIETKGLGVDRSAGRENNEISYQISRRVEIAIKK